MRRILSVLLIVALVGPVLEVAGAPTVAAQEAPSFDFVGGGYGHGVGMSQYGAHGMAAAGYNYQQILTHYYQGTAIQAVAQPSDIRVLLGRTTSTVVTPTATDNHGLLAYVNGVHTATFQPNEPVTVWADGSSSFTFQGYPGWAPQGPFSGTLELRYVQGEPTRVSLTNQRYQWGALRFLNVGGNLNVIVAGLTMEQYLYGLGEMPSSWEAEALKVQAVAGRSYAQEAVERRRADPGRIYDLDASTLDQAYVGYEKEVGSTASRWRSAVDTTAGQVARYGGKTIQAFYSSSSGGHTENSEIPFSTALPYARGVPDPHDGGVNGDNTLHQWHRSYTQDEMSAAMASLGVGAVTNLRITGTIGVSGRIDDASVRVTGTAGAATITGAQLKSRVNSRFSTLSRQFPSTKIAVDSDPFGNIELVRAEPGSVRVSGWALDPNTDAPIDVHVYIGSNGYARTANLDRPDVGAAFGQGSAHGFDVALPPNGDGTYQVCVYAINVGVGANVLLGCRSITTAVTPFGVVDSVQRQPGGVGFAGWAIDPDTAQPVDVHLYVGANGTNGTASLYRGDIGSAYPAYGPNHGFGRVVPAAAGRQTWCAYVINVGPGATQSLGCGAIDVSVNPYGVIDLIQKVSGGTRIAGWAIDPDTGAPIDVHLYVGSTGTNGAASLYRGDIGAAFPAYGPNHGFDRTVPVDPTGKDICAYAINQGAGTTTVLGCRRF